MKYFLTLLTFILIQLNVHAQSAYTISGTVKNTKGEVMQAATVFIAGSERATATNGDGKFKFDNLAPGTYQLVVQMLGYMPAKQNIIVNELNEIVNLTVTEKTIMLNEVVIGDKDEKKKYIKIFTEKFMGKTPNAKHCKIVNPELLEFSTNKGVLSASTSDFLIIENNALGYRIKYLLKIFKYSAARDATIYDGDFSFEQMTGTTEQQKKWDKNRQETYEFSLMRFLRAVYAGTSRQEGYLIYKLLSQFPTVCESIPLAPELIIDRSEKNLIKFKTDKKFYILYDKKKASQADPTKVDKLTLYELDKYGSFYGTDARIDSRGRLTDYENTIRQGFWALKRVGDQLPWEYMPPVGE